MTGIGKTKGRMAPTGKRTGALRRFARAEDGVMAPHILIFFVLMLMIGGLAVDVMRYETRRVAVQNTMDRATLAAANLLEKSLRPEDVVRDYFRKAALGQELDSVTVTEGINYRIVSADATVSSKNYFMHLMDIPYLQSVNASQAEQRVNNVEIALVLDISGSMYNSATRIANLKTAAKEFVDTVLMKDTENKISIAIVPYNGQVNLGSALFSRFSASDTHSYANSFCLDLPTSTYDSTELSRTTAFPQTPFADSWSSTNQTTSYVAWNNTSYATLTYDSNRALYSNVWCQPVAANIVRLHNNNRTTLKAQIDGLVAIGATSIDLGMKWGTALLDPSTRPVTQSMATAGLVPSYFANRPANYSTPSTPVDQQTMKVIVLMTDGENFEQERFNTGYRTGSATGSVPSPGSGGYQIWRATDNNYSIFFSSKVTSTTSTTICNSRPYYVPHLGAWHSRPWNGTTPGTSACYVPATTVYTNTSITTWQNLWQTVRVQYVAWQFFARPLGTSSSARTSYFNNAMAAFRSLTGTDEMDSRLDTICEAAKAKNILVYGIAFEAPDGGKAAIQDCVSTPLSNYYYDVAGLNISKAFNAIASNLSQLRLTQ